MLLRRGNAGYPNASSKNKINETEKATARSVERAKNLPKLRRKKSGTSASERQPPTDSAVAASQPGTLSGDLELPQNPSDALANDNEVHIIPEDALEQMHAEMDDEDMENLNMIKMLQA